MLEKKNILLEDYQSGMMKVLMYLLTRFKKTGENDIYIRSHKCRTIEIELVSIEHTFKRVLDDLFYYKSFFLKAII